MIEINDDRIVWMPVAKDEEVSDGIFIDEAKREKFLKDIGLEDKYRYEDIFPKKRKWYYSLVEYIKGKVYK